MIESPKKWSMKQVLEMPKLSVPEYQRGYAWEEDEVADFIEDIGILWGQSGGGKVEHFLGSMLFYSTTDDVFGSVMEIIDGQQRLTTTSMLVAAIRNGAVALGESEHASEDIKKQALEFVKKCSLLLVREKGGERHALLSLNEKDSAHWQRIAKDGFRLPAASLDDQIASIQRLDRAFQLLHEKLVDPVVAVVDSSDKARAALKELARRLDVAMNGLILVLLTAINPDVVYDMFMVVNDRGRPLSVLDLVRTGVLRRLKKESHKFKVAKASFNPLLEVDESEARRALVHYVNSHSGKRVPKNVLLKKLNEWLYSEQGVATFPEDLANRARALCSGTEFLLELQAQKPDWYGRAYPFPNDRVGAERQHRIVAALKHEAARPLLVAGSECLEKDAYRAMLGVIERIATRTFLSKEVHPSLLADFYIEQAAWMRRGEGKWSPEILWQYALDDVGKEKDKRIRVGIRRKCDDASFKQGIAGLRYKGGRNLMAYLMLGIDGFDFEGKRPADETQFMWQDIHLDHICPKSLHEDPIVAEDLANTIGNLTPLSGAKNKKMSNMPYGKEKSKYYRASKVIMTSELGGQYEKWTTKSVKERTAELAELACRVWSLDAELWP